MTVEELLAAATPRPWGVEHFSVTQILAPDGNRLFDIDCSYESDAAAAEAHADADLIVRAVNEYEALLALEEAVLAYQRQLDESGIGDDEDMGWAIARLDQVRSQP